MKIWADLGTLDLSWSGVPPPPSYVGAGVWRLITVSLKDTVLFTTICQTILRTWRLKITLIPPEPPSHSVYYC